MRENDTNFLRRQAEHCIALSRTTFDLTLAARLRALAEEFRDRAAHLDDDVDGVPSPAYGGNGSRAQKPGRH
jgi:hypothetical protein